LFRQGGKKDRTKSQASRVGTGRGVTVLAGMDNESMLEEGKL